MGLYAEGLIFGGVNTCIPNGLIFSRYGWLIHGQAYIGGGGGLILGGLRYRGPKAKLSLAVGHA